MIRREPRMRVKGYAVAYDDHNGTRRTVSAGSRREATILANRLANKPGARRVRVVTA